MYCVEALEASTQYYNTVIMLKKISTIFYIWLAACSVTGQQTFVKKIDKGVSRISRQIVAYEDRYFILNTGICDNIAGCSLIMEINNRGDILWEKTLKWLDVGPKSMIVENDTIFLSGNHPSQTKWLWHQMSANGGDSLATYEIFDEGNIYVEMFNLGQVKRGNQFCIYGPGEIDNNESSLLYFVDHQGNLDTLVALLETDIDSDPWEIIPDHEGNLVVFIRYQTTDTDRQTVVAKIDGNNDHVWTYYSEEDSQNASVPNGAILSDGRIVFNYSNEWFNERVHSLRAINRDSTIAWKFFQPDDGWLRREYYKISTLSDGSIVGYGQWGNVFYDPVIKRTPWIMKVSSEGEQIWQKILYDVFPGEEIAKSGLFFDGVELADGGFMVVGGLTEAPGEATKILISRLDEEGCLIDDCPWVYHMGDLLNGVVHTEEEKGIDIYPNPGLAGEAMVVDIDSEWIAYGDCTLYVYDLQGILLKTEQIGIGKNRVDFEHASGIYYIKIENEGKIIHTDKIIRI